MCPLITTPLDLVSKGRNGEKEKEIVEGETGQENVVVVVGVELESIDVYAVKNSQHHKRSNREAREAAHIKA